MILISDITSGAYQLLGRPSQADLPFEDVLEYTRDFVRGRAVDLKLSARGHTTQVGSWVTPSAKEMSSGGFVGVSQFIPVKVEWRYVGETNTRKAQIVAFEQLQELRDKTDDVYVSFYDNWDNIAFGETVEELANREYRVLYEEMGLATMIRTSSVDLPELFITLGKYEVSLSCLDQIRNETFSEERERLRGTFTAQFMLWNDRFKKWQVTQFGSKKVSKVPANWWR